MKLCLKEFVISKSKNLLQVVGVILLEFALKKDQLEMVRILMVGQYDLVHKVIVLNQLVPYIKMKANLFIVIGRIMT
jgi:hypothetical protein